MTLSTKPPLSDGHVENLRRALKIPADRTPFFRKMLESALREAWRGHGIARGMPRSGSVTRILDMVRSASPDEAMELLGADDPHANAADAYLSAVALPEDMRAWLSSAPRDRINAAIDLAQSHARRDFPSRGRPRGTSENPAFDLFVQQLFYCVSAAGGDPGSASKKGDRDVSGVLFKKVLPSLERAGQLPPNFVPTTENSKLKVFRKALREFSNTEF